MKIKEISETIVRGTKSNLSKHDYVHLRVTREEFVEVLVWVLTLEFWPRRAGGPRKGDFLIKEKEVTNIKTKKRHRHMTKTRRKGGDKAKTKTKG